MKNVLKAFGIIALVAVIGFWAVSCGNDDGGGGGNTTIESGAEVIYYSNITNLAEAKSATNFGFGQNMYSYNNGIEPLSNFLDGSTSVTVNNGKITIILGTPKSVYLQNFRIGEGATVNPSNAKGFVLSYFLTSDGKYTLVCGKEDGSVLAHLYYFDRDVTAKGTVTNENTGETTTINYSLKKGWQYFTSSENDIGTPFTELPSGFKWIVLGNGYRE